MMRIKKSASRIAAGAVVLLLAFLESAVAQFASQAQWAGASTGSANAYVLNGGGMANVQSLSDILGVAIAFQPNFPNTGAATVTINGTTAIPIRKMSAAGPVALVQGDLVSSPAQVAVVMYDGTQAMLLSPTVSTPTSSATPGGYLTPCQQSAGSPVTGCTVGFIVQTGDVTSATSLFYEPWSSAQIPIYNGSSVVTNPFTELSLSIPSSRVANTIYDVYVINATGGAWAANGSPTLAIGPAWTTSTAGSGNRGVGAGTAQLALFGGLWTNAVQISAVNGASTYTVPANSGTYVGSIFVDGTAGQITSHLTFGQSRKRGYWNAYNRQPIYLKAGDATGNWAYSTNTFRPENGNTANSLTIFSGLPDQVYEFSYTTRATLGAASTSPGATCGVGYNSTTGTTGLAGLESIGTTATTATIGVQCIGTYLAPPALGINVITALESGNGAATTTFFGTEGASVLAAKWGG